MEKDGEEEGAGWMGSMAGATGRVFGGGGREDPSNLPQL